MIRKLPLSIALAALVGFAAPALAAESHAAAHDPQVAASTAKPGKKHTSATTKSTSVKGRHAKVSKKAKAEKHTAAQPTSAAPAR